MSNPEHTIKNNRDGNRVAAQRRRHDRGADETVRDAPAVKRTAHTPGPWTNERHPLGTPECELSIYDDGAQQELIADLGFAGGAGQANARLIVAAPDMLEALRFAEKALDWAPGLLPRATLVRVRAAIAKATGTSP